jgi:hypothetical protein
LHSKLAIKIVLIGWHYGLFTITVSTAEFKFLLWVRGLQAFLSTSREPKSKIVWQPLPGSASFTHSLTGSRRISQRALTLAHTNKNTVVTFIILQEKPSISEE